jgi:Domain of unknown function (DUF4440)
MRMAQQTRACFFLGCLLALKPARALGPNPGSASGVPVAAQQSVPPSAQQASPPQTQPGISGTRGAEVSGSEIGLLRQLEENYLRAEMENDAQLAESLMADDYIGVRGDGTTADKLSVLNSLSKQPRGSQPYRIVAANMREHLFGDTACITYTKIYTQPNSNASYSENVLHILIKRNGAWHLQVSSPIPSPKPLKSLP